jgi:hypothetical protein
MKKIGLYWNIFGILVLVTIVFWIVAAIVSNWFGFYISDTNIVLTFIGVLATFVVISNYAQVQEIKKVFDDKIKEEQAQRKVLEKEYNIKIDNLDHKFIGAHLTLLAVGKPDPVAFLNYFEALHHCLLIIPNNINDIKPCVNCLNNIISNNKKLKIEISEKKKKRMLDDLKKITQIGTQDLIEFVKNINPSFK